MRRWPLALVVVLTVPLACGDAPTDDLAGIPSGPRAPAGEGGGRRADAGAGEARLAIVAPAEGDVLKAMPAPEVRVQVASTRPGSDDPADDPLDPASLTWSLRPGRTSEPVAMGRLVGPLADGHFTARMDLSRVPSGEYLLVVTGTTRRGSRGTASIPVKVDTGPRITIVSPQPGAHHKGSVAVHVQVRSAPFDPTADPVEAFVGPAPVPLRPGAVPGSFEGTIEFERFNPPLEGEQALRVVARNASGTRSEAQVRFVVDHRGPVFLETAPKEGVVVGGIVRIRARIEDPAGVLGSSVIAVIGNKTNVNFKLELKPEPGQPNVYSELFDTARLTSCRPAPDTSLCVVFPNLSFRAADALGNESTVAYDIAVDNHPPVLDLDPPADMRVSKFDRMQRRTVCSYAFDPVGEYRSLGDQPNDGCAVPQVFDLRARIEDGGNRADGLKVSPVSGIEPPTVGLYVLDDTRQPLVVDVDGDGVCDAINPTLIPTTTPPQQSNQVLLVRLAPVPPKGSADFTADPSLEDPAVLAQYPGCSPGREMLAPPPLCARQSLPLAIGYPTAKGPEAAIWAIEPITADEPWCLGSQFDTFANEVADGWACIAAAAIDRAGNAGVSAPLRVWVQRRGLTQVGPSCPAPPPAAGPAPDCTGTFDRQAGAVSPSPCRPRRFGPREILPEGVRKEDE